MKNKYIKMRNERRFDINIFWQYYKENGGKISNPSQFQEHFLFESQTIDTALGKVVMSRQERNIEGIMQGFDKQLGLTVLYDESGHFLKIVE